MKKNFLIYGIVFLILALLLVFYSCKNKPLTSQDIVDKCAEAMGGWEKIKDLKTLRIGGVWPDHGDNILYFEMKRPNLCYNPQAFLSFNGKRACLLKGKDYNSEPVIVDPEEWKDYELEMGYYFPAFFEYSSDYLGIETIEGEETYKLAVNLPLGVKMTYFINVKTCHPVKIEADFKMYGKTIHAWRDLSDYREVDGIRYPHGFTYPSRDRQSRINGRIESVEINIPLSDDKFKIPDELK
jgi:hypothetical protein